MRAVNLIPGEAGGGGHGVGGAGPFVVLGVLGLLLALVLAYVLTNNTLVERRAQVATLQVQAQAAQAQAAATRPYREFAALAQARVRTVRQLGAARFDWHRAFGDLSRVIPEDVWLSSLFGTVTTGVAVEGAASGSTSSLRAALPNPAIEMTGCTVGHDSVARLIARLRLMTGVVRVSLSDSTKDEASSGGSGDCRNGHAAYPQFGIVIFFAPLPTVPAPGDPSATPGAVAASDAAAPAQSAATTTPAASGAPSNGSDMR